MKDHGPCFRQGSGRNAVLLIHGIASSPGHFQDLLSVIPESFSVYNILLDGHNGTVEDFANTSMKKWKAQVEQVLEDLLNRHEKLVIAAHSMGTLFAIQAAIDHPHRISRLFLLSVPTRPRVRFSTVCTALRVAFGKLDSPRAQAMAGDTGICLTPKLHAYLPWIPRMAELLQECRRIRHCIPQLTVPTCAFLCRTDELVSFLSRKDLERNPCISSIVLFQSGHFAYSARDTALLQAHFKEILWDI